MFIQLIRLSWRSASRNLKRSLVTALAVAIGCFFLVLARGILNGLQDGLAAAFSETQAGDLQLHHPDYLASGESLPLDKTLLLDDQLKSLLAAQASVRAYSGRIQFSGMLSLEDRTTLFVGMGVDPANEYEVCPRNRANVLPGGKALSPDMKREVVLGKGLAEAIGASVGTELMLLVKTRRGAWNAMDVVVAGIATFKIPGVGDKVVHVPLETAQHLLGMKEQLTEVVVDVSEPGRIDLAEDQVRRSLETSGLPLTVNSWKAVGRFIVQANQVEDQVLRYIVVVMFVIMIAGVVNTLLMSVYERVREIGTLMAMGVTRRIILALFVLEALSLGLLGGVWGICLGKAAVFILNRIGLPLPAIGEYGGTTIYPALPWAYALMVLSIALLATVVAGVYPAWRASRLEPAEALRTL